MHAHGSRLRRLNTQYTIAMNQFVVFRFFNFFPVLNRYTEREQSVGERQRSSSAAAVAIVCAPIVLFAHGAQAHAPPVFTGKVQQIQNENI